MEQKLLKCPFCGSDTGLYAEAHEEGYYTFFHIHCYSCDAFGPDENEYVSNICFLTTDRVDACHKARPYGCPLQEVKE